MSADFVSMEKRLGRKEDEPYLDLLRTVQQAHTDSIGKLTEAVATMTTTAAVQAKTVQIITETQAEHTKALDDQRQWRERHVIETGKDEVANAKDHAEIKGGLRLLAWGLPIVVTVVGAVAYVLERLPK